MFRAIINFSIEHKPIVAFFVLVLIGFGIYSMLQIPIDAVPDITNNQVQVVTVSPSLSPQEVERSITYPLEIAMANITDVIEIRSISRYGLSVVTIVFKDRVPILDARQLVSEELGRAQGDIPTEYGIPEMLPITTGLGEIFQYTLQVDDAYKSQYTPMKLREIQDWIVKRQLSGISGIVEISSFGGYLKQFEVAIDPDKLWNYGYSCADVYEALARNNQNSGGSYIEKSSNAYYIRTEGLLKSLDEIENIVVGVKGGMPVLIRQLGKVKIGYAPRFGAMTANGEGEAVGGITLMLKGANSSKVIKQVKERVTKVEESLPAGITIKPYLDRAALVKRTTNTVVKNLLEGGLIVIFMLVLLLGNYRSGIIVASVIPLSLFFGFILMHLFGVSANLMSLGAIDFGIVVDGAVIIVESILYFLNSKYAGRILRPAEMDDVVKKASSRIYQSAAFGVLIILVVFIPIMTLTGIEGKTFRPMAQTFSFVIIGAFILSMTYVPMMSALFLNRKIQNKITFSDKIIKFLKLSYHPILKLSLKYKYTILIITVLIFLISIWSFTRLGGEFIPTLEEGDLAMQMTVPPGSSLSQSIRMSTKAEKILLDSFPEVEQVVSKIGTAEVPTDPMAVEDADIMIVLKDKKEWETAKDREELIALMKKQLSVLPAASFEFTQPIQLRFNELMTGVKSDIAVKIYGEDLDELFHQANLAATIIRKLPGASDVKIEQITGLPQLIIKYNRVEIAKYGVDILTLNETIRTAYAGKSAGVIFEGDRRFDLVIRIKDQYRNQLDLNRIYCKTARGTIIPISEVAEVNYIEGPMQISRDDTKRRVTIGINVRNRDVESLVEDIDTQLKKDLKLKPGYYISYGGQFENLEKARKRLAIAVPIALLLILILLFFTFSSFKHALLIFSAVPLSAVGGVAALWLRGLPFSISAGVGFIALFGVAVLNGIVLISYYIQMQKDGIQNVNYIVIKGACTRLRPVLITASTDILGFLPMAISTSAGAEVQRPLATVVIGGIITSTMLTLIILPILYLLINSGDRISFKSKNKRRKGKLFPLFLLISFLLPAIVHAQEERIKISMIDAVKMALDSNLVLANSELRIKEARSKRLGSWEFEPLNITYTQGQINSEEQDHYLDINQNFGSLLSHIYRVRNNKHLIALQESKYEIDKRELLIKIKSAYLFWIYQFNKAALAEKEYHYYKDLKRISDIKYELGENTLLQKAISNSKVAAVETRYYTELNKIDLAENKIRELLMTNNKFTPEDTSLSIYQINKTSISAPYNGEVLERYYSNRINYMQSEVAMEKSYYFPKITAGVFQQDITPIENLWGWHIGIQIPLWFLPRNSRVQQSKVRTEIARNNYQIIIEETYKTIDNLLIKLNTLFSELQYYNDEALTEAQLILETAQANLRNEEIEYIEYLEAISTAMEIENKYLDLLNAYNQTALQLEFYAN